MFKSEREKFNEFNKKLYNTSIIQGLYDRINELEARIEKLEKNDSVGKNKTNNHR